MLILSGYAGIRHTGPADMIFRLARKALPPLLLAMLAACSAAVPQTDANPEKSGDPIVASLVDSFEKTCIAHAPDFSEEALATSFAANEPLLGPDMMFLGMSEPDRGCRFYIRGYGMSRAVPTVGDINTLAEALHTRIGGALRPKTPTTGLAGAQVRKGGSIYNVFAYVNPAGDLEITVSR